MVASVKRKRGKNRAIDDSNEDSQESLVNSFSSISQDLTKDASVNKNTHKIDAHAISSPYEEEDDTEVKVDSDKIDESLNLGHTQIDEEQLNAELERLKDVKESVDPNFHPNNVGKTENTLDNGVDTNGEHISYESSVLNDSKLANESIEVHPHPQPAVTPFHVVETSDNKFTPEDQKLEAPSIKTFKMSQEPQELHSTEKLDNSQSLPSKEEQKERLPRLVIDKLVLTNFKSYAGQQIIGPFHSSFSAVVGPNGSGKSNVIDSMLFVFGFRANKMRQGKLSELIHNSEGSKKLDYCSVDIHFHHVIDTSDDVSELVPESELVISRKAYRNNSSQYYINNKNSNYTEVTTLLKKKGIDLDHKRFLILQGEVESIAQMKPKAEKENDDGLLEYLEDIIGTTDYKPLIEADLGRIEELNDICLEKENRFELVERDKNALEEKKEDTLKFLEMEKKLIFKKSISYQVNMINDKLVLEKNSKIVDQLRAKLSQQNSDTSAFRDEIKTLNEKHDQLNSSVENFNEHIKSLTKKKKAIEKEKVSIEERKKNLENKKKKSEKTLQNSQRQLNETESKLEILNQENAEFKNDLNDLLSNLSVEKEKLETIRHDLTDKTSEFTKQIEVYQKELQPWNDKLEAKKSEIQIAQSKIEMLMEKRTKIEVELENAKNRVEEIKDLGRLKEKNLINLKKEQSHTVNQITLGEEECTHAEKKLSDMKSHLSNLRQKVQESSTSLSNTQNQSKILSGLMRLQQSGRINGFYGRLGDLGVIDDKYDIAISTACPALNDMVVETVEVAQQCIEYLRKNNAGYANFICLTKLRRFNLDKIQTPRNVPRLFDLVNPKDSKFLPAFYSRLQDTLVASNLKEANSVAYGQKRWRVVTIDGKLIDKSGTLSGGGNYVAKGGMKSSSVPDISEEDVVKLKKELEEKESKYEYAQNAYREMDKVLRGLKDRKPEVELQISKINLEIDSFAQEMKDAETNIESLIKEQASLNSNDEEIEAAQNAVLNLKKENDELKHQTKELKSKINDLQEKIMDVGGVELRIQKAKVDSINQKIEIINARSKNDKSTIRKYENDIKRHTKAIGESEQEIENADKELDTINSSVNSNDDMLAQMEAELGEIKAEREELVTEVESIKLELSEKEEKIKQLKSAEIEIENDIEKHESYMKRARKSIEEYEAAIKSLEVRDVTASLDWLDEDEKAKYTGSITKLTSDEIDEIDMEEVETQIDEIEAYMRDVKVDVEVLEEYGNRRREYDTRKQDLNDSVDERDRVKKSCEELKRKRLDEFMEGFNTISSSLKEMYQMITMGGNAELELVDSLDPFSEGILFSVMPPKKSWKNISNLSGGEKTLSSLALVFALHRYKPTPLYVMDEIDAALDFRNVSIVANYIKERTKNAQFVVISLRNNMFELARQLVGIYKVNNMTRSITLQNKDFLNS